MERSTIGRIGEIKFAMECLSRGMKVLYPDNVEGFDLVVLHENKFTRVQVKTTSFVDSGRRYKWNLMNKGSGAEVYALCVIDTDLIFIIPAAAVKSYRDSFKISLSRIHYKKYGLHNWEIFK